MGDLGPALDLEHEEAGAGYGSAGLRLRGDVRARMALVLIVDDEPAELRMLTRVVERSGHRVLTASDGVAGVSAYLTHRPDWVITDLAMPEKDGIALIAEIRAACPEARIIAATGQTSERSLEAAIRAGAVATLRKPFEITQVVELLAQLAHPVERG